MRTIILMAIGITTIFYSCAGSQSMSNYSDEEIIEAVKEREFVFVANRMIPNRGRSFYLNSYYDVVVSADTVVSFLPFFGRAYVAPIHPADGGIRFTTTDFTYTEKEGRNGSRDIDIRPRDENSVQSMFFSIFNNGTASLKVTSLNRTPISFDGYIIPRKPAQQQTREKE